MGDRAGKICMLADSHDLYDDRIYWKEAVTLARAGYEVHFVLAAEEDDRGTTAEGIRFVRLRRDRFPGRPVRNYLAKRMAGGLYDRMFREAAQVAADVYHIHDLKVNRLGTGLRKLAHHPRIVYDVHEPYPENILDYWPRRGLKGLLRRPAALLTRHWERRAAAGYDLIITTEENLCDRFRAYYPGKPVEVVYNYTDLPPAQEGGTSPAKAYDAIYTGGITVHRGAMKILEATRAAREVKPDIRILFLGTFFPPELREEMEAYIREHGLAEHVTLKDAVPYREVTEYYLKSRIGLGIFLPIRTHRIILQIKIFEYLNFGLPILGSHFGHIARIIGEHDCGLVVDPQDPQAIADAMLQLLNDPVRYGSMAANGMAAARAHFRWENMATHLLGLYGKLTADRTR